jgi:hypothetical protein
MDPCPNPPIKCGPGYFVAKMMLVGTTRDIIATADVTSANTNSMVDPATPVCFPCLPGMYCSPLLPDYPIACPGWSNINSFGNALQLMISHPEWTGLTDSTKCPDVSVAMGRRLIEGGDASPAAPINPLKVYRQHMWVVM